MQVEKIFKNEKIMRIVIRTLPLRNNYGGVLQNYALQKVLQKQHHTVETLDAGLEPCPWWIYCLSWLKTGLLFFTKKRRPFARIKKPDKMLEHFELFVNSNLKIIKIAGNKGKKRKSIAEADAIVVGSDQVWRPKYSNNIYEAFLRDVKKKSIKRIAYAVSFGVDEWEYTAKQTRACSALAKKFDSISVREESGVRLCKEHLGVDAAWVLDPTLLLDKSDYLDLCKDVPESSKNYLAAYVLGMNEALKKECEEKAKERGLVLKVFSADSNASLTIPEWLAMFRDASYIVTDSFHGTAFSILFEKEFKCIYNETRGVARFESLLNLYNSGKLEEMRHFSLNWLKKVLES